MKSRHLEQQLIQACRIISAGGIVAYPTEAVFGLGCDPNNQQAVARLSVIKQRAQNKAYILIASDFSQLAPFCAALSEAQWSRVSKTWPGPHTWIFPTTLTCPTWLGDGRRGIAVRLTAHPVAAALCKVCKHALISTSANISSQPAARSAQAVQEIFGNAIDCIVAGEVGDKSAAPTTIRDALTGEKIR